MSQSEPNVLKALLREIYLLLLALLAFVNFFVPAMIHSSSQLTNSPTTNILWAQVLDDESSGIVDRAVIGEQIGIAVQSETASVNIFDRQTEVGKFSVEWQEGGRDRFAFRISNHAEALSLAIWCAELPPVAENAFTSEAEPKMRILVYRDGVDVKELLQTDLRNDGPDWLIFALSRVNMFEETKAIPTEMLRK